MNPQILYRREFDHIKFGGHFRMLLKACIAKESSRYAINGVKIDKDGFTATNGRLLFNYADTKHATQHGIYHLTSEGFGLLNVDAGNFPKWQSIVPKDKDVKSVYGVSGMSEHARHNIVYHLNRSGVVFRTDWALDVFARLDQLWAKKIVAYAYKEEPGTHPLVVRGEIKDVRFVYIQMPIMMS